MPMQWDARRINVEDIKRLEDRAAADARERARGIWQDGLPGGLLEPVAVTATYDYIARLRQESTGIPRWAWASQEAMRGYIQMTGDRYYEKFLDVLCTTIGRAIRPFRALPRTTPLPGAHRLSAEYLNSGSEIDPNPTNPANPDWSGSRPNRPSAANE